MDRIDVQILNTLIDNSRINASDIAGIVGLSVPAVIERIKKLENASIIKKYTTIVDFTMLGSDVMALIMVSMEHPKYNDAFVSCMVNHPNIIECHYIAGDFDYLVKVASEDTNRLERVLNDIKCIHGVSKTKTMIILSTLKNEYSHIIKDRS